MTNQSVKDTLIKHNFRFNKKFGQNFLTDTNLLAAIADDAEITENDTVVEVGPGAGTLTAELAKRAKKVIAYEIDKNLAPVLEERLAEFSNVEIRFMDIMKESEEAFEALGKFKVVANLPYYITTPVTMFFLEKCKNAESVTVMVQEEVADRFQAKAGTAEYGAITIAIDYYGSARVTRRVDRKMFYPSPNVDSAVITISRRQKYFPKNEELFLKTVKAGFLMRRKTLANNLMSAFSLERSAAEGVIERAGLDKSVRGERLSTADYVLLSDELDKIL